jgi:hypothetical protein
LFYVEFHHTNDVPVTETYHSALIVCTSAVFAQVFAALIRPFLPDSLPTAVTYGLKTILLVTIYASFFVLIYSSIDKTVETCVITPLFVLIFVMMALQLVSVFGLEASAFLIRSGEETEVPNSTARVAELIKLIKDMTSTTELAKILCVMFLYVHFRTKFFLEQDTDVFANDLGYVEPIAWVGAGAVIVQVVALISEMIFGPHKYLSTLIGIAIVAGLVGVIGSLCAGVQLPSNL